MTQRVAMVKKSCRLEEVVGHRRGKVSMQPQHGPSMCTTMTSGFAAEARAQGDVVEKMREEEQGASI